MERACPARAVLRKGYGRPKVGDPDLSGLEQAFGDEFVDPVAEADRHVPHGNGRKNSDMDACPGFRDRGLRTLRWGTLSVNECVAWQAASLFPGTRLDGLHPACPELTLQA